MDFNQFKIYSEVSTFESSEKNNLECVLKELDIIQDMSSATDVIEYLQSKYSIDETTRQFYIVNNMPVKIYNEESYLSLEISIENKEFWYSYKKGELDELFQ